MILPKNIFPPRGYTSSSFRPILKARLKNIKMPESMNMLTDGPAIPQQIEPLTTWCSDPKVVFGIAGAFLVVMLVLCIIYEKLKFRRRQVIPVAPATTGIL
ncbi:uncharacterized protein LOC100905395 isoform X3 [Galendromus occidentalis]|uniref:Uncharacterized protein LOC100905395 isoform X3 n=1 Tax=Galendromus occidentalis TaxID=34638 RepID=A0AAJ7L780_9ACAR|nr:uncharacterized protein LOC100905395 isoform X3 [Galendromus occidentalis]